MWGFQAEANFLGLHQTNCDSVRWIRGEMTYVPTRENANPEVQQLLLQLQFDCNQ
jgi:hypothetical protein